MFSPDVQKLIDSVKTQVKDQMPDAKDVDILKQALHISEGMSILKSAQGDKEMKYSLNDLCKSLAIIAKMSEAGYGTDKSIAICKAIFIDMSDANLDAAFDFFDTDKGGSIDAAEMKAALPLLGESVPEEKLEELFKITDQDKNGKVDKVEFRRLVRGLNSDDSGPFASFRKSWDAHWRSIGEKLGGMLMMKKAVPDDKAKEATDAKDAKDVKDKNGKGAEEKKEDGPPEKTIGDKMKESWSAMNENTSAYILANKAGISMTLGPTEQTKIGKVIARMTEAEYSQENAVAVVKTLFTDYTEEDTKAAFAVFDTEGKGSMSKESFTKAMPLMGEDLPADKVDEAFKAVDTNSSGKLELAEFVALLEIVNPLKAKKKEEAAKAAEAPAEAEGPTLKDKWNEFTSRFASKKEEAPETKKEDTPETKAEPEKTPATAGAN